jgi:hypothetical protein
MTRIAALLVLSLITLSACQEDTPAMPEGTAHQTCAAALVTPLIGEPQSALDGLTIPQPFRIILPGMAVTMDHRPERTNIEIDDAGHISRVWCG